MLLSSSREINYSAPLILLGEVLKTAARGFIRNREVVGVVGVTPSSRFVAIGITAKLSIAEAYPHPIAGVLFKGDLYILL